MIKKIAIVALLAALPVCAQAAPSITGATQGTGTITLSGSGFGAKTQAAPLRFDNFDDATTGQNIAAATGWWSVRSEGTGNYPLVSTEYAFSGWKSVKAASAWGDSNPAFFKNSVGYASTGKLFVSFWFRWKWPEWTGGTPYEALQYKFFRVAGTIDPASGAETSYPVINHFFWHRHTGTSYIDVLHQLTSSGPTYEYASHPDSIITEGQWHNIQVVVNLGTQGTADGWFKSYLSRIESSYSVVNSTNPVTITIAGQTVPNGLKFDNFIDENNATIVSAGATVANPGVYYDDIYVDTTFQRVEIGDAATYAGCTKRAVLPPTAWSDTGITVSTDVGGFTTGDSVYVYAFDADNAVSAAYGPITIGSGSGLRRLGIRVSE